MYHAEPLLSSHRGAPTRQQRQVIGGYLDCSVGPPRALDTPRAVMIKMVLPTGDLLLPGRWVLAVPGLPDSGGRRVPSDQMSCTESTPPQIHGLPNGF